MELIDDSEIKVLEPFDENDLKLLADLNQRKQALTSVENYDPDIDGWYSTTMIAQCLRFDRDIRATKNGTKERQRLKELKEVENLQDSYVKQGLIRKQVPITEETLDLKRNILLIKRLNKKVNGKFKNKTGTNE